MCEYKDVGWMLPGNEARTNKIRERERHILQEPSVIAHGAIQLQLYLKMESGLTLFVVVGPVVLELGSRRNEN